jgi:hypothetical protein
MPSRPDLPPPPPGTFAGPPPAPPEKPAGPPRAGHTGRGGGLLALAVAAVALLVAVIAVVVSVTATGRAREAQRQAEAAVAAANGTGGATPERTAESPPRPSDAAPTDSSSPTVGPELPPLNPETVYKVGYQKTTLTLRSGCNNQLYIDLDFPRVAATETAADLSFTPNCSNDAARLRLQDGVSASLADTPALLPADCAKRIQTAALGEGLNVPLQQGVVMCIVTSGAAARAQGLTQKMVLLEVKAMGRDESATVEVSAWDIPR